MKFPILLIALFTLSQCTENPVDMGEKNVVDKAETTMTDERGGSGEFDNPDKICKMPSKLVEISGLTDVEGNTVACVQDEFGIIYFYDLQDCKIIREVKFAGIGDFEGITRVGNDYYALRSDGTLFEIIMGQGDKPTVKKIKSNVPAGESEGLAYDQKTNRLLIAPKGKFEDKSFGKDYRAVYAYDLNTGKMLDEPVMQLNLKHAEAYLIKNKVHLPQKKKDKKVNFQFDISSLAVHPEKDLYYLLTNQDHILLIVNREGEVVAAHLLDEKRFPQPEGLTFLENNQLVISTEGSKGKALMAVFNQ